MLGLLAQPSVLVVDDDLPILQMIEIVLARSAMSVEAVTSGSAAIECLAAREYSAIVLDLTMPNVSGFEVIAHMKQVKPEWLPRVVIITAMTDTAVRRLDRSLVHSVMSKPFDINALVRTVQECIAQSFVVPNEPPQPIVST